MYKFFGYVVANRFFNSRAQAQEFCQQNRLPEDSIVMIYNFEKLPYVEPKESEEWVEP